MQQFARHFLKRNPSVPTVATRQLSVLSTVRWSNSNYSRLICPKSEVRFNDQQLRFRRHDRASAFTKPRPKSKKQRKAYNRRLKKFEEEKAQHKPPGYRAGPRRQFIRERWQQLLDTASEKDGKELVSMGDREDEEYEIGDALMEDLLGNTAHLTSQATPEPVYLGHLHKKYYNIAADQMSRYRAAVEAQAQTEKNGDGASQVLNLSTGAASLPSDESISKVLRAYRDRYGTRSRPIGIAMALEHILKELGVPIVAFGEFTYTTLMTCCRTPIEARRIMKLMNDQQHPISAYSWSILVDIHAKLGEFEECVAVIKEMALEGTPPTQAAYTSLMAACYKVCNDGRIPHAVRAKAGEIGWNHWQEMRIVGIEADAMAYGAIIRLCAARGQAERAINLLEEMNRFEVRPTTLCFSGALRAVARSHEIGIRFERGSSKKQLRRELFAAHHGNMARQIVIMAENAEVEQDESFVSALMLCAAAAGDSATAKAVFLASEVRRMDHLRTIGPDSSLKMLRGENPRISGRTEDTLLQSGQQSAPLIDPGEPTSDGHTFTQQDTLKPTRPFEDKTVHNGLHNAAEEFGLREYGADTRSLSALLRACGQSMQDNGLGTMWAGRSNQGYLCENSLRLITTRRVPEYTKTSVPDEMSKRVGISSLRRYDENDPEDSRKKGATRKKFRGLYLDDDSEEVIAEYADIYGMNQRDMNDSTPLDNVGIAARANRMDGVVDAVEDPTAAIPPADNSKDVSNFDIFFEQLRKEAQAEGMTVGISEEEARELFFMLHDEFSTPTGDVTHYGEDTSDDIIHGDSSHTIQDPFASQVGDTDSDLPMHSSEATSSSQSDRQDNFGCGDDAVVATTTPVVPQLGKMDAAQLQKIAELQAALPGMPIGRLRKVVGLFDSTLGYPSLLALVPTLRESLPDNLTLGHLKWLNSQNADFVMSTAEETGLVDQSLLNAMLQVRANASSLDEAINFHQEQFRRYKLRPNAYSDRLVIQMLIANSRLSRALDFKSRIEEENRILDLPSYGTLVEYFGRHNQLGSAMLVLEECLVNHGSAPSEKYLSSIRTIARKLNMDDELGLAARIGEDPIEWLKHGERHLKRERSKKGKRNVLMA